MIDANYDICGGRLKTEGVSSKKSTRNKYFNAIDIHPSSMFLMGVGNSKYACLYHIKQKVLMKRFELTNNRSIGGVLDKLNSNKEDELSD